MVVAARGLPEAEADSMSFVSADVSREGSRVC